jgi:FkbM family methyltransferase
VECHEADYLLFSTRDAISNALYRTGKWDEHLLHISKYMISGLECPLILDIGANLGAYSIPLAKHIQKIGGKVIGFEPQRIVYYQLCGNIVLNRLDNYEAIYNALGEDFGFADIPEIDYEVSSNIGAFSLDKKFRQLHGIEISIKKAINKVSMIKLDGVEVERAPALIKIDVEGYELNVLRGGINFLDKHDYPPILFEAWNFDWFVEDKSQLMTFISELGYKVTNIGSSDWVAQHPRNQREISFQADGKGAIKLSRTR